MTLYPGRFLASQLRVPFPDCGLTQFGVTAPIASVQVVAALAPALRALRLGRAIALRSE